MTKTLESVLNGLTDRFKKGLTGKVWDSIGPVLNGNAVLSIPVQPIFNLGTCLTNGAPRWVDQHWSAGQ